MGLPLKTHIIVGVGLVIIESKKRVSWNSVNVVLQQSFIYEYSAFYYYKEYANMNPITKQKNIEVELRCYTKIVAALIVNELVNFLKVGAVA